VDADGVMKLAEPAGADGVMKLAEPAAITIITTITTTAVEIAEDAVSGAAPT